MLDSAPEPEVVHIGPHRIVCGPDMYFAEFVGDLRLEHMPEVNAVGNRYVRRNGYKLILVDASRAGTMTPEARRMNVENLRKNPGLSATAIFGTSMVTRTIVTLLFKAMDLLSGREAAVAFFKTEAEARAWLDVQRVRLLATRAGQ